MADRDRVVSHERAVTRVAAGGRAGALQALAEQRTEAGPLRDFDLRDFAQEGLEEGADWRNYLVWGVLQLDESHRTDPAARAARVELHRALALVAEAFEAQLAARALLGGPA